MMTDDVPEEVETFLRRHGVAGVLEAYEAYCAYERGELTLRLACDEAGLDNFEGMTIIKHVERAVGQLAEGGEDSLVVERMDDLSSD